MITTIPAIVIRPELSTTGLNTSLADPNGQWTATAKAKIIEKNDTYWEFSFFVDMTNRTDEEQSTPSRSTSWTLTASLLRTDTLEMCATRSRPNPPNGCWIGR